MLLAEVNYTLKVIVAAVGCNAVTLKFDKRMILISMSLLTGGGECSAEDRATGKNAGTGKICK